MRRRCIVGLTVVLSIGGCSAGESVVEGLHEGGGPNVGLFQVIINVRDMQEQIAFYRDVMGFTIVYPSGLDDYSDEDFVRFDTSGAYLVLHTGRRNENAGDEPRLSFMTDDLEDMRATLLTAGVWVDEVRSPAPGVLVADARDPEGNAFHIETRVAINADWRP